MADGADDFAASLNAEVATGADEVERLLAELEETLSGADGPRRALRWLTRASDPHRTLRSLPSLDGSSIPVQLGSTPWARADVLGAIRATVGDA